ncbi:hypothetical protein CDD81_7289 [Ophiocordyceps australis]|uniref:Major facilitator superfamily (MFS) profile domain-containing protein n=1 Tax=Ophiocordyceps australis TaxID=1399860 RepID=A0A2C5Y5Z4_9HYPO|nr:hypothetical protein CDD81_7289 [Ophiocordyceps australis]
METESMSVERHASLPPREEPLSSFRLGRNEYLQILSTSIVHMNTWGLLLSSGAFQLHYKQSLLSNQSTSNISWISTTCGFFALGAGTFTGPLFDRGHYKSLLLSGSLLQVFGLMMLSLSTQYYQIFLSYSICFGLGTGTVFTPSLSAAAACLSDPAVRARATGVMASGSCIGTSTLPIRKLVLRLETSPHNLDVGGIIFPLMFRYLLPSLGFAWTIRCIALLACALYLVSYLALLNPRHGESASLKPRRRLFDSSMVTDPPFLVLLTGATLYSMALYIPMIYLPLFTTVRIPLVKPSFTLDLLAILNGSSIIGRLASGLAAAFIGPLEVSFICLVFAGILLFCWIAVYSVAGIIVWSVFWGMVSGVLFTLPGAFIPLFCPSIAVVGSRLGTYWLSAGIGMLLGSPIAGAIYGHDPDVKNTWRLQIFSGLLIAVAIIFVLYSLTCLRRKNSRVAKATSTSF